MIRRNNKNQLARFQRHYIDLNNINKSEKLLTAQQYDAEDDVLRNDQGKFDKKYRFMIYNALDKGLKPTPYRQLRISGVLRYFNLREEKAKQLNSDGYRNNRLSHILSKKRQYINFLSNECDEYATFEFSPTIDPFARPPWARNIWDGSSKLADTPELWPSTGWGDSRQNFKYTGNRLPVFEELSQTPDTSDDSDETQKSIGGDMSPRHRMLYASEIAPVDRRVERQGDVNPEITAYLQTVYPENPNETVEDKRGRKGFRKQLKQAKNRLITKLNKNTDTLMILEKAIAKMAMQENYDLESMEVLKRRLSDARYNYDKAYRDFYTFSYLPS